MSTLRGLNAQEAAQLGWEVWWRMLDLLRSGVVHGDLNEYNVLVDVKENWEGLFVEQGEDDEAALAGRRSDEDVEEPEVLDDPKEQGEENEEIEEGEKQSYEKS